jgi:hypothetical protein
MEGFWKIMGGGLMDSDTVEEADKWMIVTSLSAVANLFSADNWDMKNLYALRNGAML